MALQMRYFKGQLGFQQQGGSRLTEQASIANQTNLARWRPSFWHYLLCSAGATSDDIKTSLACVDSGDRDPRPDFFFSLLFSLAHLRTSVSGSKER
jgi:hypothetical protein